MVARATRERALTITYSNLIVYRQLAPRLALFSAGVTVNTFDTGSYTDRL